MQKLTLELTAEEVTRIERALTNVVMDRTETVLEKEFSDDYTVEHLRETQAYNQVRRAFFAKARQARMDAK